MKKIIGLLLILAMSFSLCACGKVELPPLPAFPTPTAPEAETTPSHAVTPAPENSPSYAVTPAPESGPSSAATPAPEAAPAPGETPVPIATPLPADPAAPTGEEVQTESGEAVAPGEDVATAPADALAETQPSRVIVTFQSYSEKVKDPATGEIDILNFAYVTPVVYLENRDLPAARINEYIAMLDESFYTGNDYGAGTVGGFNYMLEIAEDNFTYIWDNRLISATLEYSATRDVRVERADDKMLNLVFTYYEFTGGTSGRYSDQAVVFDTGSGERLSLDMLAGDYDALASFLVEQMLAQAESDDRITPEYIAVEDRPEAFRNLLNEGAWYFDGEGLVMILNPNDASANAGIIDFHVPYEELRGLIDDKWFPAEGSADGSFEIYPLEEKGDNVVLLDRVVLDENESELCLVVEGSVYDVFLTYASYAGDGKYKVGDSLWYCSSMSDCALQLAAMIPDAAPNLMLRYHTADGEQFVQLITESGEDGHPFLMDAELDQA